MAYTAQTGTKRHTTHSARDTIVITPDAGDAPRLTTPLPPDGVSSVDQASPTLDKAPTGAQIGNIGHANSLLIESGLTRQRDSYMSTMGLVIYLVALVLYGARLAV